VQFGVFEKFTNAYLFQTAQEKPFDYLLIIYKQKFQYDWAEETHVYHEIREKLHHPGRVIWKQKIWLAICDFLFRNFPVNQFNFKVVHSISTVCTNFVSLYSKNFKFLHCLGLIDMLSANQHGEIFSCIIIITKETVVRIPRRWRGKTLRLGIKNVDKSQIYISNILLRICSL